MGIWAASWESSFLTRWPGTTVVSSMGSQLMRRVVPTFSSGAPGSRSLRKRVHGASALSLYRNRAEGRFEPLHDG